jgi:hypothetical protein
LIVEPEKAFDLRKHRHLRIPFPFLPDGGRVSSQAAADGALASFSCFESGWLVCALLCSLFRT